MMNRYQYRAFTATKPHTRDLPKPLEDCVLADPANGFYMVLDGITRIHEEYEKAPFESAACKVNEIVSEAVFRFLSEHGEGEDPIALLRRAVLSANDKIRAFRGSRSLEEWGFYPGTLGIVGLVRNDCFYYVYLGDCVGVLLRDGKVEFFGTQTGVSAVEKLGLTKEERYAHHCNHPESEYCYGIFNGDEAVCETLDEGQIQLKKGDVILLASDGLSEYLKEENPVLLGEQTPEEMIEASASFDQPPYRRYADDKGIVKITVI
ncbi:MAG: SpoIIE family protein phosphatase [Clostridia bacterium]|nr:SpoIIE family protein phosphatase [Clostridia bacterium]